MSNELTTNFSEPQIVGYPGVDTITVGFPVHMFEAEAFASATFHHDRDVYTYRGPFHGVHVGLRVTDFRSRGVARAVWGVVEISTLGQVQDRRRWSFCPAERVRGDVEHLLTLLAEEGVMVPACTHMVDPRRIDRSGACDPGQAPISDGERYCGDRACRLSTVKVHRVDVGIDFADVLKIVPYLDQIQLYPQGRRRGPPVRYGDESIFVTTGKEGKRASLYDKHLQTPEAPEHTVRFEVRFGRSGLKRWSLVRLADLDAAVLCKMLRIGFKWAGLDVRLGGRCAIDRIAEDTLLSDTQQRSLVGDLAFAFAGRPRPLTAPEYARALRRLGIVRGQPLFEATGPPIQLSIPAGRELRGTMIRRR